MKRYVSSKTTIIYLGDIEGENSRDEALGRIPDFDPNKIPYEPSNMSLQQSGRSTGTCFFVDDEGEKCNNKVEKGHRYCVKHRNLEKK